MVAVWRADSFTSDCHAAARLHLKDRYYRWKTKFIMAAIASLDGSSSLKSFRKNITGLAFMRLVWTRRGQHRNYSPRSYSVFC